MIKPALIALALLAATPAGAQFAFLTQDATAIGIGQSVTYSVIVPDPTFGQDPLWRVPASFGVFFYSGDGQVSADGLNFTGGGHTFTYLTPGTFQPYAVGEVWFDPVICNADGCQIVVCSVCGGMLQFRLNANPIAVSVPEPATWALLLFGFAFFAIKGIWPRSSHE